jgi:hypothetical protein
MMMPARRWKQTAHLEGRRVARSADASEDWGACNDSKYVCVGCVHRLYGLYGLQGGLEVVNTSAQVDRL